MGHAYTFAPLHLGKSQFAPPLATLQGVCANDFPNFVLLIPVLYLYEEEMTFDAATENTHTDTRLES